MRYYFSLLLVSFLCTLHSLEAINGLLLYGIGPRNRAMGGANCAAPVDTSTVLINPAGIGALGKSADLGAHLLYATGFANSAAGHQDSGQKYYLTPFAGISYKGECSSFGVGGLLAGVAGEGAKYDLPRINPDVLKVRNGSATVSETGDIYDTSSFLFIIKAIAGVSYNICQDLTLGVGIHINQALFSADIAIAKPDGIFETNGDGRLDVAYGGGFSLGILYEMSECFSLGAAFTSPQWFEEFGRYVDLVPNFRLPPQVRAGLAFKPLCRLLLTADYKWIGWEAVGLFDKQPTQGGFGWKDQHTIGVGAQYTFCAPLIARLGYNYGRSPIQPDVVFANALIPAIYESHLAGGLELMLGCQNSIAASVVYTFPTKKVDNGRGDLFSQLGKGTVMKYHAIDVDIAWKVVF